MESKFAERNVSRLEKTSARLQSQIACLGWVFRQIKDMPGLVFELGLGRGRTYDHMRFHLGNRRILTFDREIVPIEDCRPPDDSIIEGELAQTLPEFAARHAGQVVLSNSDLGSYTKRHNETMTRLINAELPPAIASGGFVLSDLPLDMPGFEEVPLPSGAVEGHYRIFRKHTAA